VPQDSQRSTVIFANGIPFTFKPGGDKTTYTGSEGWVAIWRGGIDANPKSLLKSVIGPNEIHLGYHRDHKKNFLECVKSRQTPASEIDSACQPDFISQQKTSRSLRAVQTLNDPGTGTYGGGVFVWGGKACERRKRQ